MKTLLFYLSLLFAVESRANTLVDNFSIVNQTSQLLGGQRGAQPFRTGVSTFILTEIAFAATSGLPSQFVEVKIYDDEFFRPHIPVATLYSGTAGAAGFTIGSLDVPAMLANPIEYSNLSLQLEPDMIYWLVVENHSSSFIYLGYTGGHGSAPAQGEGYIDKSALGLGLIGGEFSYNEL